MTVSTAATLPTIQPAPRKPTRSPAGSAADDTPPLQSSSQRPKTRTLHRTKHHSMGPHALHAGPLPCRHVSHRSGWDGVCRLATMDLLHSQPGMARSAQDGAPKLTVLGLAATDAAALQRPPTMRSRCFLLVLPASHPPYCSSRLSERDVSWPPESATTGLLLQAGPRQTSGPKSSSSPACCG